MWIYDAVRTPRGKARPDGGLAAFKPQELVGGLIEAMAERGRETEGKAGAVPAEGEGWGVHQ